MVRTPLWNVQQVSTYLSISERTVRDLVYKRQIPYRKVGRCVRFDPNEIEQWTRPETNKIPRLISPGFGRT